MANKKKTNKNAKAIVGYSILCLLLIVFVAVLAVGAWNQGSSLIEDRVLLNTLSAYFDKAPRKITEKDLATVQYMAFTGADAISFGDEAKLKSVLGEETESSEEEPKTDGETE